MDKSYFELSYHFDEPSSPTKSVSMRFGNESSWSDICDGFVGYLQACGFLVNGATIMDYFAEAYTDYKEAINDSL